MKDRDNAVFDALQRAKPFLDENEAQLTGVDFSTARKRLDDVLMSFTVDALNQEVADRGVKGETAKQRRFSSSRVECSDTATHRDGWTNRDVAGRAQHRDGSSMASAVRLTAT